ncbi:menaquinone-dependent protoporphyrinogen oxidase [Hamadaea flava]|uniref:Flavodoxin domain-containing protein n=1 Tax=Hamadaea flava TaxID=1742688 RepID=A0ABV8LRD1_9ACTN|nr:flavodoxin domain-containing protein [Hamadaea flava]MCP2328754.1 menaquinone-dependent protoporphyrinogen oxidase [Hamadaea flava]
MTVLIAYGSKRGGTAGLADMIGAELVARGIQVEVRPAAEIQSADGYRSVIVAGALYNSRWHRDARRFTRRHRVALRQVPVWLVASGPLDNSANAGALPPVSQVARIAADLGALGAVTFGGRLTPDAKGLIASAMAKTKAGDWRDPSQVRAFATAVAEQQASV